VIGVFAVLIAFSMIATAGLLAYYGKVETTANVGQSVVLSDDGGDNWRNYNEPISYQFDGMGGDCEIVDYLIKNRASVEAEIDITTSYNTYGKGTAGVDVTYYKYAGYSYDGTIQLKDTGELEITVEEDENWVIWTFDYPVEDWTGNGIISTNVIIASDDGIEYQIHNNDGVDSGFAFGEWLYSEYDDGWHTGTGGNNQEVDGIWWIQASGERDAQGTDGILQIKIHKSQLGETFYWASIPNVGSGWNEGNYGFYPTPSGFTWSDTDNTSCHEANFWEELTTPFTLQPGEELPFRIKYCFAINIMPGQYDITSTFVPVE